MEDIFMAGQISKMSREDRIDASIKGGMLEACARHSDMFLEPRLTNASAVFLWTVSTPSAPTRIDLREMMKECRP
ncbi:hypothetical protein AD946_10160 [Gluconobacter thailandicus]|nr:hypothetical protein AD946_10160 [Gluconobacter thailandicus]